jgi:hypothetical protein
MNDDRLEMKWKMWDEGSGIKDEGWVMKDDRGDNGWEMRWRMKDEGW